MFVFNYFNTLVAFMTEGITPRLVLNAFIGFSSQTKRGTVSNYLAYVDYRNFKNFIIN
jgi:hypothetical protein